MPESVDDPVLGHLDWEESPEWWVGAVAFAPGHRVNVFVVPGDESNHPEVEIRLARESLARVRECEPEIRRWSADRLLVRRWNTERPMSVEHAAGPLRVASLEFGPDPPRRIGAAVGPGRVSWIVQTGRVDRWGTMSSRWCRVSAPR